VPDGRPEPWRGDVDVLEGGLEPSPWRRRWTAFPGAGRRLVAALGVLLLIGAVVVWSRERAADRERAQRVDLATSLGVWSSSTSPPGGQVGFFVLVRNDGERAVSVTSVSGVGDGLLLRMRDEGERAVPAGAEVDIPMSVRLSCAAGAPTTAAALPAEIGVRRQDGGATTRQVELEPAVLVLDVAATLCAVRPALRDHELSGPVLRGGAAKNAEGR
jgi:hypothetical protein